MIVTPPTHTSSSDKKNATPALYRFVNRNIYFYPVLLCIIIICSYLNYSSTTMSGMLHYYEEFAKLVTDGIYSSEYYKTAGSFPMWGYGYVLAITQNKALIIVLQQLVNLLTIYSVDVYLQQKPIRGNWFSWFRILLLVSFPLYFFHSILWPYSFSSSFLILGMIFLVKFIEHPELSTSKMHIILSAVFTGTALNFRSDYLLAAFLVYILSLACFIYLRRKLTANLAYMSVWMVTIILCLLPWAFYTKKVNDHYLLNSTNAGHVLYIGLGQLPGNKWKIVPYDEDSSMKETVLRNLHPAVYSTTTFRADSLLKKEWFRKVKESPGEFIKKCGYNFLFFFIQPFTEGDGFKDSFSRDDIQYAREHIRKMNFGNVLILFKNKLSPLLVLSLFTALFSIVLMITFWVTLLKNIKSIPGMVKENKFLLLSLFLIFYQIGLQTAGYYHRHYNTNIYLLYLIVLIFLLNGRKAVAFGKRAVTGKESEPAITG